jgi:hypothetical protein
VEDKEKQMKWKVGDVVGCVPSVRSSPQVIQAATERLLDFDERVRIGAIKAVCDVAATDNQSMSSEALVAVTLRLRDTKLGVRKQALTSLLAVFRKGLLQGTCMGYETNHMQNSGELGLVSSIVCGAMYVC